MGGKRGFPGAPEEHQEEVRRMPVLMSHGAKDLQMSMNGGIWLRDFLQDNLGCERVRWHEFDGKHEVPGNFVEMFVDLVLQVGAGRN